MAITDLQISDTLTTDAPSIKYEGNQGPQSPQQERQVAQLKQEYLQYVFEQKDRKITRLNSSHSIKRRIHAICI